MTIRKRGAFCDYEFWMNGKHYSGTFNGKNGQPICADKREAREFEAIEKRKVRNGEYDRPPEREELKDFGTFVDQVYLPFAREHHASPKHDEFRCEMLKEHFTGKQFDEITMMSVVSLINKRLNSTTIRKELLADGETVYKRRSPTTVNKEITLLSSIFLMAKTEKLITGNPCDELPKSVRDKIPARRKRNRRLLPDEEKQLFEVGLQGRRQHLAIITEVAIYTGMRKGELLRLKPEHINFTATVKSHVIKGETWDVRPGWLIIEKTKNGQPRTIPMSPRVRARFEMLCSDATCGEHIFSSIRTGRKIVEIKRGFNRALLEAGIKNLTFHDLRHEWSSRAAERGVPEHVRRDILGHSSGSMTGDYTHASPEAMETAMELVANFAGGRIFNLDKISTRAAG